MEERLRAGAAQLGVALADGQVRQLLQFAALLQKWGGVYNLTALRSDEEVVTHHLLDSLAVVDPLSRLALPQGSRVIDVGSGAGLPGVVIAIVRPDLAVDCVDAVAKKAAFIQQVAGSLVLPNLTGRHARVETLRERYTLVTCRAFASLPDLVRLTAGVLEEGGCWMAMKGRYPADEVAGLPPDIEMFHVEQLRVPGLGAERCLVWMRRRSA